MKIIIYESLKLNEYKQDEIYYIFKEREKNNNYIWYPIFYDMDTMLGLNNTGFNKFSYDTEDDPADKVFNGFDSVLWNNFRECFQ